MRLCIPIQLVRCAIAYGMVMSACHPERSPSRQVVNNFIGTVSNADGTPAAGASIAVTNLMTKVRAGFTSVDRSGAFQLSLPSGDYAVTVTSDSGFALLNKQAVPDSNARITLSSACHLVKGCTDEHGLATQVSVEHRAAAGNVFTTMLRADGCFAMCVPEGYYDVSLRGDTLSTLMEIRSPSTDVMRINAVTAEVARSVPPAAPPIRTGLDGLVSDIVSVNPLIVGMGEATHGTAEFVSSRGELTLALMRGAGARLLLFEVDAIAAISLDDYVTGGDVDIAKAVAALGFWVTDTYEFLSFLKAVRDFNATAVEKVHIWGIDLQDTKLPVGVLLGNAVSLNIDHDQQAMLQLATVRRGKDLHSLEPARLASLEVLLSRLSAPRGAMRDDLLVAVAARSLSMQLHYWDGDMRGEYRRRRDSGMAALASFITSQLHVKRACLWAHDGHVAKQGNVPMLGQNLAAQLAGRYYNVGFYLYAGSVRAWDAAAKIGVISHAIPSAPPYTLEGAIMQLAGFPQVAWVPLRRLPTRFRAWLDTPRLVREVGAVYIDANEALTLRNIPSTFDAVVVIKNGRDSTPTPTGVRRVTQK
jgi:erythromycin esterase